MAMNSVSKHSCDLEPLELKNAMGIQFIHPTEIVYIKANNKHSIIYKADELSPIEVHHPLKWFSETLSKPVFFRCHDSYLVNLAHLNCLSGNEIILSNNLRIPLSRNKKIELKENIKQLVSLYTD